MAIMKGLFAGYKGNTLLIVANSAAVLFYVLGLLVVTIYGLVSFGIEARAWANYLAIGWVVYFFGSGMHFAIFLNFPLTTLFNLGSAAVSLFGVAVSGIAFGFYSAWWGGCFFNQSSLSSTQLEICEDQRWVAMFAWISGLVIMVSGIITMSVCVVNALIIANVLKSDQFKNILKRRKKDDDNPDSDERITTL